MKTLDYKGQNPLFVDSLTPEIRVNVCKKEPETVQWIEEYFKPEDTFVNVGANCGGYSLIASLFCNKVYAFEPSSFNFSLLLRNIKLNNLEDKIEAFPFKISDYTTVSKFLYNSLEFKSERR